MAQVSLPFVDGAKFCEEAHGRSLEGANVCFSMGVLKAAVGRAFAAHNSPGEAHLDEVWPADRDGTLRAIKSRKAQQATWQSLAYARVEESQLIVYLW